MIFDNIVNINHKNTAWKIKECMKSSGVYRYIKEEYPNRELIVEEYFHNGKRHRDDGPAFIRHVGGKVVEEIYYRYGKRHREDGPALIERSYPGSNVISREEYYRDDKLHRGDGPARVMRTSTGEVGGSEYYQRGRVVYPSVPTRTTGSRSWER